MDIQEGYLNYVLKFNAHAAHIRLWKWLSENPNQQKDQWPEWIGNGGCIPAAPSYCFGCLIHNLDLRRRGAVLQRECDGTLCPIKWGTKDKRCTYLTSLYSRYRGIHSVSTPVHLKEKSELALRIAQQPWSGPKMVEFKAGTYKITDETYERI